MRNVAIYVALIGLTASACATTASQSDSAELTGRAMAREMAVVMVDNRAYETAIPLLQRGISEDPNDVLMHRLLGVVLRDKGLFEDARKELDQALELSPDDPEALAAAGVLYDLMGHSIAAEAYHRRAIEIVPMRPLYHNNLGFCLFLQRRDGEAVAAYNDALHYDPNLRRTYNNLGFVQARMGQYDDALRSFEQAGGRASALASMGLAYEIAGKVDKARVFYANALRLDRHLKIARRNLDNLDAEDIAP